MFVNFRPIRNGTHLSPALRCAFDRCNGNGFFVCCFRLSTFHRAATYWLGGVSSLRPCSFFIVLWCFFCYYRMEPFLYNSDMKPRDRPVDSLIGGPEGDESFLDPRLKPPNNKRPYTMPSRCDRSLAPAATRSRSARTKKLKNRNPTTTTKRTLRTRFRSTST